MVAIGTETRVSLTLTIIVSVISLASGTAVAWTNYDNKITAAISVNADQDTKIKELQEKAQKNEIQYAEIKTSLANLDATLQDIKITLRNR